MCGIAGVMSWRLSPAMMRQAAGSMAELLAHRGPDAQGVWEGDGICLAHRRLSIVDLSQTGAQPMHNEDGSLTLVCNGEIYNAPALRSRLRERGHHFRGTSDNEVILHLYEEHGQDCVDHLIGMFAFALWDAREGTLMLARDRIGEKPLHYAETADGLWFASEPKALLGIPGVNADLDPEAVSNLLVFAAVPAPLTFFRGIRALPPASVAVARRNGMTTRRYWRLDFSAHRRHRSLRVETEAFGALWRQVVQESCVADVPVAVTLSGGVDSSSVAAEAVAARPELTSYCLSYSPDDRPDPEAALSTEVAATLGTRHRLVDFDPFDLARLPGLIAAHDQPLSSYPILQADQMARAIAPHQRVALTGNGADEVFGGYSGYRRVRAIGMGMGAGAFAPQALLGLLGPRSARLATVAKLPLARRRGALLQLAAEDLGRQVLTEGAQARLRDHRPGSIIDHYAAECAPRDYLDTVTYSDLMVYHQHGTTVLSDVAGMRYGLEYRSPFLDVRILEFAAGLDRAATVPVLRRTTKRILRHALRRHLPDQIINTPKMGFGWNIPYGALLRGPWRPVVDAFVRRGRYLDLDAFTARGAAWAAESSPAVCWTLLCFSLWCEIYLHGRAPADLGAEIAALLRDGGQ